MFKYVKIVLAAALQLQLQLYNYANNFMYFRMIVAGPSMSGKSYFMFQLVKYRNEIFTTQFHRIMYCIPPESQHQKQAYYQKLKAECNEVELILGLPKEENVLDNTLPKLILLGKNIFTFLKLIFCYCKLMCIETELFFSCFFTR